MAVDTPWFEIRRRRFFISVTPTNGIATALQFLTPGLFFAWLFGSIAAGLFPEHAFWILLPGLAICVPYIWARAQHSVWIDERAKVLAAFE